MSFGKRKAAKDGAFQTTTSKTSRDHIPRHGGPQTGNGFTSNNAHKPKGVVNRGKDGKLLRGIAAVLRFPDGKS